MLERIVTDKSYNLANEIEALRDHRDRRPEQDDMNDDTLTVALLLVVGLPIALVALAEVAKRHIRYKERKLELMADQTAERAAQYAAHVERLEARMRVLERIATDKGTHLADEIEDLRDPKVN